MLPLEHADSDDTNQSGYRRCRNVACTQVDNSLPFLVFKEWLIVSAIVINFRNSYAVAHRVNIQFRGQDSFTLRAGGTAAGRCGGGDPERVFIVSIPDYAYTPYGSRLSEGGECRANRARDPYHQRPTHRMRQYKISSPGRCQGLLIRVQRAVMHLCTLPSCLSLYRHGHGRTSHASISVRHLIRKAVCASVIRVRVIAQAVAFLDNLSIGTLGET